MPGESKSSIPAVTTTRKGIHSIIDAVEVDDKTIRIVGSRDILDAAIAGKQIENGMFFVFYANGAPGTIRTSDPQIRSLVLYPAELRARFR
jgi:hypothetical protein